MAFALRIPLMAGCLIGACLSGTLILLVALTEADSSLVAALEGKALAHARSIKDDVETALRIGIPLEDIRGAGRYLEEGAQDDPDIRFAVLTDLNLARVHYGGIGRRRLDPLLASPAFQQAVAEAGDFAERPMGAVESAGFSMVAVPLMAPERQVGFVVVAVQAKQVREALLLQLLHLAPAAVGMLLLLLEYASWTARSVFEDPLQRLAGLMARFRQPDRIERSGRNDRSETGLALLHFNGIVHRLADRAERVLNLADEVQRAVFDRAVAREAGRRAEEIQAAVAARVLGEPLVRADPRPSDLQMSLALLLAAAAIGGVAVLAGSDGRDLIWPTVGFVAALGVFGGAYGIPGWGLVASGTALLAAAVAWLSPQFLPAWSAPFVGASLGVGAGAAIGAGHRYVQGIVSSSARWLLRRVVLGAGSGALLAWTMILENAGPAVPYFVLGLLGLAVLAANSDEVVRRRLFARQPAGPAA